MDNAPPEISRRRSMSLAARAGLAYLLLSLLVFGRSLSGSFVYDDHMRVQFNPGITSLARAARSFWDRTTQAGTSELQRDNYRPLVTLNYAADYALWKLRPALYRLENLVLHALNATLMAVIGELLLGLSPLAAFIAGLIFLLHPVQTEAVVWIASRSDVLSLFFLLLCVYAWERYRRRGARRPLVEAYVAFVCSLLSREIAVVIPVVLLLNDALRGHRDRQPRSSVRHLIAFGGLAAVFIAVRRVVLGQTAQTAFWGGNFFMNLLNVSRVWPIYLRVILWPARLRAMYSDLEPVMRVVDGHAAVGVLLLLGWCAAVVWFRTRRPRVAYGLALFLVLWLPGSNLVPLTTLFAERLVYPLMIPVGFGVGLGWDWATRSPRALVRVATAAATATALVGCGALTVRQVAVWQNDETLWTHATRVAPRSWFGWYSLALVQMNEADVAGRQGDDATARRRLDEAEHSFISALKDRPPVDAGGRMFRDLSRVCQAEGKIADARDYARRAAALGFPSGT